MDGLTVLYDRDCGFCRTCMALFLRADLGHRLTPAAIQSPAGARLLPDLTPEQRLKSFHVVDDATGAVFSGGPGLARLMATVPLGAPAAALLRALPKPTAFAYNTVAGNRHKLGPLIPDEVKRRATAVVDARSAADAQAAAPSSNKQPE